MIAALTLICAMVIVGCSPSQESRLGEFKLEGERLVEQMIELIPAELEPVQDAEMDSRGVTPQNGWSAQKRARDSAHWKVFAYLRLASQEDASATAIKAVSEGMKADGWKVSRVRVTGGGKEITEGFSKDDWYIEATWGPSAPGHVERLDFAIFSPDTIRGDHNELTS